MDEVRMLADVARVAGSALWDVDLVRLWVGFVLAPLLFCSFVAVAYQALAEGDR